jgi:hypothetical protein
MRREPPSGVPIVLAVGVRWLSVVSSVVVVAVVTSISIKKKG